MINAEPYTKVYLSYELGVMIGLADSQPVNIHMEECIQRLCKNAPVNPLFVVDGIIHAGKEYGVKYTKEQVEELLEEYGLKLVK